MKLLFVENWPRLQRSLAEGMSRALCLWLAAMLAGCASFRSKPLTPARTAEAFEQRSLADTGLKAFLETNGVVSAWPRESWDITVLTLAAFYYHPDMDLARAMWHTATAGKITAGQRPNPSLSFTPGINSTSIGSGMRPWILVGVLDIPLETMGKRKHRLVQAQHIGEAARFHLANTAWLVRSRVRASLLGLQTAQATAAVMRDQAEALGSLAQLVERQ